ncbi:hypothetical protein [Sediminicurvatus halobius]|nr:hypothetical protein [Spiribacter halobius]UEX77309.1 hypothetical protein LMH63_15375 [Spiribacter halobius]
MNLTTRPIGALAPLFLALAMSACTKPYASPEFHPDPPRIRGIASALDPQRPVDVITIHGMCHRARGEWMATMHERLASLLGGRSGATPQAERSFGRVQLRHGIIETEQGMVRHHAIVWSPFTAERKRGLCYDSTADGSEPVGSCAITDGAPATLPVRRAPFNSGLKASLLNDCLADAVIYAGEAGDELRDQVAQAVVRALAGAAAAPMATEQASLLAQERRNPLFFISESLGSRILFDALRQLQIELADGPAALQATRARTRQVFMVANQIPILDLARPEGDEDSLQRFARGPEGEFGLEGPLPIVAFSDPNDLLSYTLHGSRYEHDDKLVIQDVLYSNAYTFLWFAERPTLAHTAYLEQPPLLEIIACGSPKEPDCPR